MHTLQGKVILITGALGVLGRSAIPMFLERGAIVAAADRIPLARYADIGKLMQQYGEERFFFKQSDVNDERSVIALIAAIEQLYGRLDGSYHNAYTNVWKPALELELQEWEDTIRGTMTSTFLVCKYALELMIRSGGGSIVNTSSALGSFVSPGCLAYAAAKAGVEQLTRVLAADYAQHGIRANTIVPGDFNSVEGLAHQTATEKAAIRTKTWLGRSGNADEVNELAAFLLSDAASYITGAAMPVDGGFHG